MNFYTEMINKLKSGEPFKFSRWGDGEWGCMAGWQGENRDGNKYLPELGESLRTILDSEPNYYMGLQYGVLYNEQLREYVFNHLFVHYGINWVNGDVLHQASEFGYLPLFIDALRGRNVIVIGAEYFSELPYHHITTEPDNSYHDNESIFMEINSRDVTGYNTDPVYLVASAMNSNVIIDKLPDTVTAIDIGSVFDPYLGRPRASYQHKMNVKFNDLW